MGGRKRRLWSLLVAVGLLIALLPVSAALADGSGSPAECTALAGSTGGNVATAPEGFVIDAICIKSGEGTFGGTTHSGLITADGTYDGFVVSGIGTDQVTVDDSGAAHDVSHIDYRVVEEPPIEPEGLLAVVKTADGTFDRDHDWSIEKSADQTLLQLPADGSGDATITWTIDVTYDGATDSNHAVTGSIEITNGESLFDARIDSVDDSLGTVDCGVTFPHTLAPDAILNCDYSLDADGTETENTVTVDGEYVEIGGDGSNDEAFSESDTATIAFEIGTETNATVNVDDLSSEFGAQDFGSLNAADLVVDEVTSFTYSEDFTYEGVGNCEELTIDNTATVSSEDGLSETADETVVVETECLIFQGETATGDGLPWSNVNSKVKTWFEFSPFEETDGDIVTGRNLTDIGDFEYTDLVGPTSELCFALDDPWVFADASGNVKIEPLDEEPEKYLQPGQFSHHFTLSGDSGCVEVPDASYGYAIHLDVGQWVSLGFGDLA